MHFRHNSSDSINKEIGLEGYYISSEWKLINGRKSRYSQEIYPGRESNRKEVISSTGKKEPDFLVGHLHLG